MPPKLEANKMTDHPYRMAFLWGLIWQALGGIILTLATGKFSFYGFGRLFAATMVSSIIVGFLASRSKSNWSFVKIGLVYILTALLIFFLMFSGGGQHA